MRVVMFILVWAASVLGQVRTQVALVLPEGGGEAVRVVARAIGGDLDGLPVLPRGGVTAIGVVTYGDGARAWLAQTVVDNETIGDVVRVVEERAGVGTRARARGSWESGTGARAGSWEAGSLAEAMVAAGESIAASGFGGQRHVFVLLDDSALAHGEAIRVARDDALARGLVEAVHAVGVGGGDGSRLTRQWLMEHVCDSHIRIPRGWSVHAPPWERSIAMATVLPKAKRLSRRDGAIEFAGDYMQDAGRYAGLGDITRHVMVVTGGPLTGGQYPLTSARSEAVAGTAPAFHLIHALARAGGAGSIDRSYMRDNVTMAFDDLIIPEDPLHPGYQWSQFDAGGVLEELTCGIAAEVDAYQNPANPGTIDPDYQTVIRNMLSQAAHLLGDYDRDGTVEITFGGGCFECSMGGIDEDPCGDDWMAFLSAVGSQESRADWNFDREWDGDDAPPGTDDARNFGVDFSKFMVGAMFSKGHACP